jgi:hypothetical protein
VAQAQKEFLQRNFCMPEAKRTKMAFSVFRGREKGKNAQKMLARYIKMVFRVFREEEAAGTRDS